MKVNMIVEVMERWSIRFLDIKISNTQEFDEQIYICEDSERPSSCACKSKSLLGASSSVMEAY